MTRRYTPDELKAANARRLWHPMAHPQAMRDAILAVEPGVSLPF